MAISLNQAFAYAYPYSKIYADSNKKYKVDPNELAKYAVAIAIKESNLNPNAKNKNSSAAGLMQLINSTRKEIEAKLGLKNVPNSKIYDPEYAMQLGVWYLLKQYNRYGNWQEAVHAYNQGSVPGKNPQDGENYAYAVMNKFNNIPNDLAFSEVNRVITSNGNNYIYSAFI
jgi:soluble lytic murein transglycosylase-like protein